MYVVVTYRMDKKQRHFVRRSETSAVRTSQFGRSQILSMSVFVIPSFHFLYFMTYFYGPISTIVSGVE